MYLERDSRDSKGGTSRGIIGAIGSNLERDYKGYYMGGYLGPPETT